MSSENHDADAFAFQLVLRARLDRENELLVHRTAWVVGSQAFLFSAYSIAVNGHPAMTIGAVEQSRMLATAIPWVAVVALVLLNISIAGNLAALIHLWRQVDHDCDARMRILLIGRAARLAGMAAPVFIPLAFLITWLVLIIHRMTS